MNKKGLFGLFLLTVLILSACGPSPKSEESENKPHSTFLVSSDNNDTSSTNSSTTSLSSSFNDTSSSSANNSTSSTVGHTHTWSDWTVTQPATCTKEGKQVRTCSGCRLAETQVINALGHSFGDWTTVTPASCTESGSQKRVCSRCNAEETETINPLGHNWDNGVVTVAATETTEGVKTYTCERCHITRTETIPVISQVHYYNGYYDTLVSWTDGEDLKNQLNTIIRNGYTPISYTKSNKQNYDSNIDADHSKYDFEYLDVIYSNKDNFKTETNKGWQREHAWCASLMCGSTTGNAINFKGRATDFHNLFAANASGNQSRGNKNYGNADKTAFSYTTTYSSDNGKDGYRYDENIFEPGDIDKGRLARAIFYMATMYKDAETDTANNINMKGLTIVEDPVTYVAGNDCKFSIGNLSELLEWNDNTPVDYLEMQHNISVYTNTNNPDGVAQGNRNPYVDYPELVDYVYGSKKNQPGTLKDVVASASYLDSEDDSISHYAIKEAKREYGVGETVSASDYKVVAVKKNYTYSVVTTGITHSLSSHPFTESDGDAIEAKITTPVNEIKYQINLNPLAACSTGALPVTTTGINKKTPDVNQSVTYGNVGFLFNFSTTYDAVTSSGMTINNISAGGITVGSGTRILTKLTISTQNSYTVDKLFIKAMAGNVSSSYTLTIKVGDTVVFTKTVNDSTTWKDFGGALNEPLTGQISFVFTGTSSLKINSIAFNALSI